MSKAKYSIILTFNIMKKLKSIGKEIPKSLQKNILGGVLADCKKDCGGGASVTCSGVSCTTTDYGCYAQSSDGVVNFQKCGAIA
jgi:hypothetical protein